MARKRNEKLAAWMADHHLSAGELAAQVNTVIADLTGSYGTVGERGVFRWLSGEVAWPNERQRVALQRITGLDPMQLGFRPRGGKPGQPVAPDEDPVYRRAFLAAATAAGAALASPAAAPRRLGSRDVDQVNAKLAGLVSMDNRYGGTPELERYALDLARETLDIQQNNVVSARVRSQLYAAAAAFTTSAMWAAIDGRRLDNAPAHLNQAVTLAGLAGDPAIQFRVWGHASTLYRQLGRHTDALAAAEASRATPITRRDPLYASLALARMAVHHADLGDAKTALRTLGQAQDYYNRAQLDQPRPPFMGFFDQAELDSLATFTHLRLGRWADAELHGHRCLARLRPDLHRNRALTQANLALAQIGQGDIEPAVASAKAVPADMAHGRTRMLLDDFTRRLAVVAPRARETQDWTAHWKAVAA
jgi:tetratricopeptide (TPR) repeat protein